MTKKTIALLLLTAFLLLSSCTLLDRTTGAGSADGSETDEQVKIVMPKVSSPKWYSFFPNYFSKLYLKLGYFNDRLSGYGISLKLLEEYKAKFAAGDYAAAYYGLEKLAMNYPELTEAQTLLPEYAAAMRERDLYEFPTNEVYHVFTHCLVAFPELNLSKFEKSVYDIDCITVSEFKKCLEGLYKNNYILVDINTLYDIQTIDGVEKAVMKKTISIPKGKKAFVFSVDDVVYDARKAGKGMVDKIIVKDGRLATYTKLSSGEEVYSFDNEIFPILDNFIAEHPDFSWNNARCTLALTGFQGILGYRTYDGYDAKKRKTEISECQKVVDFMKAEGYTFASHSYGHRDLNKHTAESLTDDIEAWNNEVAPLVGSTNIFIYAYGARTEYDDFRHKILLDAGFKVFCGTGVRRFTYSGFPFDPSVKNMYMDRRGLTGNIFRMHPDYFSDMFDVYEVYDNENRYIKFKK